MGLVIVIPTLSSMLMLIGDLLPPFMFSALGVISTSLPCSVPKYLLVVSAVFSQLLPLFLTHPDTNGSLHVSSEKYNFALVPTIGILYIVFPVGGAYLNHAASLSL